MVDYLPHPRRWLVLGISGGVDSTVAGRLAQLAVEQYRRVNPEWTGRLCDAPALSSKATPMMHKPSSSSAR